MKLLILLLIPLISNSQVGLTFSPEHFKAGIILQHKFLYTRGDVGRINREGFSAWEVKASGGVVLFKHFVVGLNKTYILNAHNENPTININNTYSLEAGLTKTIKRLHIYLIVDVRSFQGIVCVGYKLKNKQ